MSPPARVNLGGMSRGLGSAPCCGGSAPRRWKLLLVALSLAVLPRERPAVADPGPGADRCKPNRAALKEAARRCRAGGGIWNERWWRESECKLADVPETAEACAAAGGSWISTHRRGGLPSLSGFCAIRSIERCLALGGTSTSTVDDVFLSVCDLYGAGRQRCRDLGFVWVPAEYSAVGPECVSECPRGTTCSNGIVTSVEGWTIRCGGHAARPEVGSSTTAH